MWYQRGVLILGYHLAQAYRGWSGQWRVLGVLRVDGGIREVGGPAGWTGTGRAHDSGFVETAPW